VRRAGVEPLRIHDDDGASAGGVQGKCWWLVLVAGGGWLVAGNRK
jgi:hypothetical protein